MKTITIKIQNNTDFNPTHIFECGQFFRYKKINNDYYIAFSLDKKVEVFKKDEDYYFKCDENNVDYFNNFFDLETDYYAIKNNLIRNFPFMKKAINFGYGIRILKQNILEMIISFIISANNRIPRIQKSIEYICEKAGTNMGDYYAFPTLEQLSKLDEQFFLNAKIGFRAKYMVQTIKDLQNIDFKELEKLDTPTLREKLIQLKGVGPKVADCILLFGFSRKNVFPVDTWIAKVYEQDLGGEQTNRVKIAKELVNKFSDLSGYAQQYLFYYKRSQD